MDNHERIFVLYFKIIFIKMNIKCICLINESLKGEVYEPISCTCKKFSSGI